MATSRLLVLFGLISLVSAVPTSSTKQPFRVWHFTDVHVDPWYAPGSDAAKCYCETYTTCPRMGKSCGLTTNTSAAAPQFGSSEGNCATPVPLYQSALDFVSSGNAGPIDMIYFTGDFAEAGASYACSGSEKEPGPIAERQILDIINSDWHGLKESFPEKALGCLGNHDSSPGDLFFGADRQSWLYDNLTALWASELDHNPSALLTLKRGGYWAKQNPQSGIHNSSAYLEGQRQFEFLNASLQDAASVGDTIHILGHQPPYQPGGSLWQPGFWKRYMDICAPHSARIAVHLYGHIHTDQWSITRSCDDAGCASEAVGVLIPGPSLTEGYPATNPSLRIIDFDADTFALMEIHTYTADLHKANQQGKLEWELEYAMTDVLGTKGLSPSDFAAGVAAMAQDGSAAWDRYKGMGNGGLFCGGYSSDTAPFVPANPCEKCEGTCKEEWIASLNGTSLPV